MYGAILLLHLLGATVWTGGHLVLAVTVLPRALRERLPAELLRGRGPLRTALGKRPGRDISY